MGQTLIDSSVLVAFFNEKDSQHNKAFKTVLNAPRPLIVHEYVALEVATILILRTTKQIADGFLHAISTNADFKIALSTEDSFIDVVTSFMASKTKPLSFTHTALLTLSNKYSVLTFDEALNRAIKKKIAETIK